MTPDETHLRDKLRKIDALFAGAGTAGDGDAAECRPTITVRITGDQGEKAFCRLRRREGEARPEAQATERAA